MGNPSYKNISSHTFEASIPYFDNYHTVNHDQPSDNTPNITDSLTYTTHPESETALEPETQT